MKSEDKHVKSIKEGQIERRRPWLCSEWKTNFILTEYCTVYPCGTEVHISILLKLVLVTEIIL